MIALVEGSERQKTPNEVALNVLLTTLTIVFLLAVVTLQPFAVYSGAPQPLIVLVALLVCLIPTTIGALLSAIGIAGMDRLVRRNVLAMSGRAVEAAGDVDVLLLDKTGTITLGNRQAADLLPAAGIDPATARGRRPAVVDGRRDPRGPLGPRAGQGAVRAARAARGRPRRRRAGAVPGADPDERRRPARDAATDPRGWSARAPPRPSTHWVRSTGGHAGDDVAATVDAISASGGTPLVVAEQLGDEPARVLGVIHLKDVVKEGMRERFDALRAMGIRTVMVTGDNPLTAKAIGAEAGVDDVLAEATPEDKLALIRREQEGGRLVAMAGDGTNDAPALAQADVGVAMNTGTTAAKEAGNMVDLDSNPTKLLEIVEIGKQLLITRGALTTFSVANDVAKYFAILPAMFVVAFPQLGVLNVMHLTSPQSAILSAVIFNALIIVALLPLALRGVRYTPVVGVAPCCAATSWSTGSAASSPRSSGSSSSTCSSLPWGCPDDHRHPPALLRRLRHRRLRRARPGPACGCCSCSRSCSGSPTRSRSPGIAQVAFPWQANGSLVSSTGERVTSRDDAVGSLLIGQAFDGPEWFHPRPSAAGDGYDTLASAGSNLGPLNEDLLAAVEERRAAVADAGGRRPGRRAGRRADGVGIRARPGHLAGVRASSRSPASRGSGGSSQDEVRALVDDATVGRDLGVLGEPRVNVLRLNLALQTMGS